MAAPPRDRSDDDAALVQRSIERDERAFGELVRRYLRRALAVAWEFCDTREDAEDIVQDAFTRVARSLDKYDAHRPFAPWLFTIVRNAARDAGAARSRRVDLFAAGNKAVWGNGRHGPSQPSAAGPARIGSSGSLDADMGVSLDAAELGAAEWSRANAVDATSPAERAELRDWIGRAVDALPRMQRACFRLCEVEGFTRAEVAAMLGITEPTVRVHLHRARLSLRIALKPLTEDRA